MRSMPSRRRAMALASIILVMAVLNIAVLGVVVGGGDDSRLAALRASTLRAFYAAESAVHVAATEFGAGRTPPAGPITMPDGSSFTITLSASTVPLDATVVGRSGEAVRRVVARIE